MTASPQHPLILCPSWPRPAAVMIALALMLAAGCSKAPQRYSTFNHKLIHLTHEALYDSGIAFITPSSVTGQEEEKQAVAFTFADALSRALPDLKVIHLPETLSAINAAGLADPYHRMYESYKNTGIFDRETLVKVGKAMGVRYLGQLKLAAFYQGSMGRLSLFGLRMVETKFANIRLFFQIWDADTGGIVWEGVQELNWSEESVSENTVTLQNVLTYTARQMAAELP